MQEVAHPILKSLVIDLYKTFFDLSPELEKNKDFQELYEELKEVKSCTTVRRKALFVARNLRNSLAHVISSELIEDRDAVNSVPTRTETNFALNVLFDWYLISLKLSLDSLENKTFEKIFFYGLSVHFSRVSSFDYPTRNNMVNLSSQDYLVKYILSCMSQVIQEIRSFSGTETKNAPSVENFELQIEAFRSHPISKFLTQAILFLRKFSFKGGSFVDLGDACSILISYHSRLSGRDQPFYNIIPKFCYLLEQHAPTMEVYPFLFDVVQKGLDIRSLKQLSSDVISPFPIEMPKLFEESYVAYIDKGTIRELKEKYKRRFKALGKKKRGAKMLILEGPKFVDEIVYFSKWNGSACYCYVPSLNENRVFSLKNQVKLLEFAK